MKTNIAFAVILMLCSAVANAAIHNVPGEYSTIQDAINVSVDGDVVLVADGVYTGTGNRDIHFEGKDIRVESVNGPETCIIDCQGTVSQPHTGFIFDDGEGSGAGLVGLTIRNGYAAPGTVTNGGAINCFGSNPSLINCIFHNNSADNGGAIYLLDTPSPMLLFNCLFFDNTAASDGGAISANITSQIMIYSCTFAGNSAGSGGALDSWHANFSIRNSIIWDNTPEAIHHLGSEEPQVVYSNIQGGYVGDGNLDVEPVFTSSGSADYFLSQTASGQPGNSPCVDAGSGQSSLVCFQRWNLYYCLDEATTRTDGVYDTNHVDMGFHFGFQPWSAPTPTPTPTNTPTVTPTPTPHDTIRMVPEDYATIQEAIDAAFEGDVISVADGTYTGDGNRDIRVRGRAITIESRNGPENCIIDCQGTSQENHRGFSFRDIENMATVLDGFTIRNGYVSNEGGAINSFRDASPLIMNCIIEGNYADICGGICLGNGTLVNSVIENNIAEGYLSGIGGGSGGVCVENGVISGCFIRNNTSLEQNNGGVWVYGYSHIENSVIADNTNGKGIDVENNGEFGERFYMVNCLVTGHDGSGIRDSYEEPRSIIVNSIIWGNDSPEAIRYATVFHSNIEGGAVGEGNISADPLLVVDPNGNYYLSQKAAGQDQDSPCLDAGYYLATETDVTGPDGPVALSTLTTRTDHVADTGRVDMGPHMNAPDITIPDPVNGVSIYMPADSYSVGDLFRCEVIVTNATDEVMEGYPLMVLLESYGEFFYAPSFSTDMDSYIDHYLYYMPGETLVVVLPEFTWPEAGSGEATWYAALLDPGMTTVFGEWDVMDFRWE